MQTLKLKATVNCLNYECWRGIEITQDKTLEKLAEVTINAIGFDFDHAFGFYDRLDEWYFDSGKKL
jgi:hypothetical protein